MEALNDERKRYTSDEFLAMTDLPEHCELIDGYIYEKYGSTSAEMSAAPNTLHQRISGEIFAEIRDYIKNNHGKCAYFHAPFDVRLNEYNTVQPDILVVCDPDKIDNKRCVGAPDWVIEILSPSNENLDMKKKMFLYRNSGVREYWIVDPEDENVLVYVFGKPNTIGFYTFNDEITVNIYKDAPQLLSICIKKLLEK